MTKTEELRQKIEVMLNAPVSAKWGYPKTVEEANHAQSKQFIELLADMGCGFRVERELGALLYSEYIDSGFEPITK